MDTPWVEECISILSTMNSANAQAFGEAHALTYALILSELGAEAGRAACVQAIKTLKWRPSPAELREIAANLVSPLPAPCVLWGEFWHKAIHQNYATPAFTHPLLDAITVQLGGWRHIRSNYWPDSHPAHIDALRSRFDAIYAQCSEAWREAVCAQLAFPAPERDPRYFPHYVAFNAPKSLPSGEDFAPLPPLSELMQDAPPEVKAKLKGLRRLIGS